MRLALIAILVPVSLLFSGLAVSQSQSINVVTTAVPFLRIGPDARAGGLADNGLTTTPDANNMFWNLAKTPFSTQKGAIGLNYTPWLKDIGVNDVYMIAASGYYKLDEESAISGGFRFFNLGDIQFTDFFGNPLSTGKPTEMAIDFGYSRKLSERWGIGAALRYINSNLARGLPSQSGVDYKAGNTLAGDLSFYFDGTNEIGKGFKFGLALTNLGGKVSYTNIETEKEYIPANLGLGFSYNTVIDDQMRLMLALDVNKLMVPTPPVITGDSATDANALFDYRNQGVVESWFSSFGDAPGGFSEELQEFTFSLAGEFAYQEKFFVRAGYYYENPNKGNRKYATAGFGLRINESLGLDFSYLIPSGSGTNRNPLSNTLRFGLSFDFPSQGN
jgi:hypothetical protein